MEELARRKSTCTLPPPTPGSMSARAYRVTARYALDVSDLPSPRSYTTCSCHYVTGTNRDPGNIGGWSNGDYVNTVYKGTLHLKL